MGNSRTLKFIFIVFLVVMLQAAIGESLPKIKVKHKNDEVVMENGDRITGEIKKMEFGVLYFKSDRAVDTLKLDWERVVQLQSIARYEFETQNKDVYVGIIAKDENNEVPKGELEIILGDSSIIRLRIIEIISVHEMGRSFLSRISLDLDAGASFTSANSRKQSTINVSALFRRPKYSGSLDFSTMFSSEPGTEKTERYELQLIGNRFLKRK